MLVKCPSCNTEYNCEPGKYQCACGVKFMCTPDGSVFVVSELDVNSRENMSSPGRMQAGVETNDMTIPMPGISGRKMAGRFKDGELILGRYMVLSELGQGSVGVVYKCFDETAKMVISVESLPPDLSQNTRKMEEVKKIFRLVCSLHHPKIVCCNALEMDHATGNYYLIMECIEGEDLRRWIERMRGEGGLTLKNVLPVIRQIASALDYAHGENVFLLDLKPGGIMIDQTGQVKMLGFGLAEQIRAGTTGGNLANPGTGDTAPYMAPEQWRGNPRNAATDQYALAVLSYEMLAGHLPFDGADEAALRQAVLTLDPEPIASLPEQAQAAIGQAMSKDPANRFLRCSDFADALEGKNGESSAVSDSGPIRQEEWVSVSAAVPPQSPERRNATVPPRREPPEQKLPGGKKKRGRKVFGILFVLVAITAVILFAFYKRNEIPGLSGFVRNLVGEKQTSDDASDLIFDDITTSEPFDRVRTPDQNPDERKTIALSDNVRTPDGEQPGDTLSQISDDITTSEPFDSVRPSDGEQPNNASVLIFDETKTIALSDSVTLELVKVEAGTFEMSAKDGENKDNEVPHQATLTKDFYIGRTEVTQAQWNAVMGNNPSEFKGDDLPVEKVSWNDAMEFCEKLNSTGKAPSGWKFTLPTETQWEFAARGGNKSNGFKYSGGNDLDEVAWYSNNSNSSTHPVGQKDANELGLYDMSGNVYEWCLDTENGDSSTLKAEFTRDNWTSTTQKALRGGQWGSSASACRPLRRISLFSGSRNNDLGFRLALVPESY